MPSVGIQELLLKQEQARIEQLSRDAWKLYQPTGTPIRRWRRTLGLLLVMLAIVATLMTSLVTATSTASPFDSDSSSRNCVAHRASSCKETPFPVNRQMLGI
jgi:hypothetical protein